MVHIENRHQNRVVMVVAIDMKDGFLFWSLTEICLRSAVKQ